MSPPLVLGLESTCDETAAAFVRGRAVLSSVVASQHDLHAEYGGVVPEIASRAHAERVLAVVRAACAQAGASLRDAEAVAVAHRPGLIGSLLVGVAAAKALSWSLGVPIVGVNHVHAHLDAAFSAEDDPRELSPALGLVASGGHTALYACVAGRDPLRLGGTLDDAVGEAFDKAAAILGLAQPGGPAIEALAAEPGADAAALPLPVSRLGRDSLDFSFSGLKTAVLYAVRGVPRPPREGVVHEPPPPLTPERRRDIAASFQAAAVRALRLKIERAIASRAGGPEAFRGLLAGGGVIANRAVRAMLAEAAAGAGVHLRLAPPSLCGDNAAMIGLLGARRLAAGRADDLSLLPSPVAADA